MFNKLCTVVGSLGLALILIFGRDVASYLTTSASEVSDSIRSQVPIDFEIKRARKMISDLTPEIRENMISIAQEEIAIEQLNEQIAEVKTNQAAAKKTLSYFQEQLSSDREEIKVGKTVYTSAKATDMAESHFERYKTHDATLKSLRRTVDLRQQALDSAREQLSSMVNAKEQLVAEVANLEARQKINEMTRASHQLSFDESQLTRTRQLIQDIETRVRVEERVIATELHFMEEVAPVVESGESQNIALRIANYFDSDSAEVLATKEELFESFDPANARTEAGTELVTN